MTPRRDLAVGKARGEAVEIEGPVEGLLDVLLAGPDDLDRPAHLLGDANGLGDAVDLEPPPEAAADQMIVDDDLFERQSGELGGDGLGSRENLVADPDLASVGTDIDGAVHRLHWRMRQERYMIGRFDELSPGQGLGRVPGRFRHCALAAARSFEGVENFAARDAGVRPLVPGDVERLEALLRRPHMVPDDCDEIVEHNNLPHARHSASAQSSTFATLPPNTGQLASVAIRTFGGRASMP